MPRQKRVDVSHKARRLVERSIRLHVDKATTYFCPDSRTTPAQSNADRDALARRARLSKQTLLEYVCHLETALEASHNELRRLRMAANL